MGKNKKNLELFLNLRNRSSGQNIQGMKSKVTNLWIIAFLLLTVFRRCRGELKKSIDLSTITICFQYGAASSHNFPAESMCTENEHIHSRVLAGSRPNAWSQTKQVVSRVLYRNSKVGGVGRWQAGGVVGDPGKSP
jgi:hypothetical protein